MTYNIKAISSTVFTDPELKFTVVPKNNCLVISSLCYINSQLSTIKLFTNEEMYLIYIKFNVKH